MSLTVVSDPDATESVVTITVQFTLAGTELPPAASRLINDLEALAGQPQYDAGPSRTPAVVQSVPRALRLVGPNRPAGDEAPPVRRVGHAGSGAHSLSLRTGSRLVSRDGVPVPLTRREYDLFHFLCDNPRRVFQRSQLLRQVWGYDMVGTERTVDVHVRRLRVKLGECAPIIATVRGVGYRLDDEVPVEIVVRED